MNTDKVGVRAPATGNVTMPCRVCACENPAGSRFCTACGNAFAPVCAACGRDCPETARFCGWCGAPRKDGLRLTEPAGERKQATVLFADIAGSTELIAGLDAEAAMNRLQPVVMAMVRAVRRFDGTVLRTLGDGIKAAFGLPHAREGHALLACQAALAMRDAVAAMPDAPAIRIGLHAGEVVSSAFDTGSAIEQEAQGLTVHLASRIEQITTPGDIFISRACRVLVGAYCDTESLGGRALRGIPDDMEIYRLIGLKPAVNSDHFRASALVPLRGRDDELAILQRALTETGPGSTRVIGLSGPPGVGKSRLCFEFGEWCRTRQMEVLEGRAHVFGQATPLLPVLEVLRTFCRIPPRMEGEAARERIAQTLTALDPLLAPEMPILAEFLGYASPDQEPSRIDPGVRHARLRDIARRMIKAAGRRTSVIIVEDLHWLDEASRDFLETFIEAVDGTKILVVLTFRPTWSPPWPQPARYRELAVAELGHSDVRQVIQDLIGPADGLEHVTDHVAERSAGNPFFAEELILSLAQSGVLLGERGHYRLAASGWQNPVLPTTVEAVIGARIDLLPAVQKTVLRIGAVIGKEFPLDVVADVGGYAESPLRSFLDQLRHAEMIQPRETPMGESFAFRHPLIQEVAYAMLLRATRVPLHAAVAKAIEGAAWGARDEFAGLLAYHYESAGMKVEAAMRLQRGARWIGRMNSARALADWRKVRGLMEGQPRNAVNDQLRAHASGQIMNFGWREGMEAEEARPFADEAIRFAREAGNRKHEAMLVAAYGRIVVTGGVADDYVKLVREALTLMDKESNPEGMLLLNGLLCQALGHCGLLREALAANNIALSLVDDVDRPSDGVVLGLSVGQMVGFDVSYWIRALRARLLVLLGRFDEAQSWLDRVIQVDPEKIDPVHQSLPHYASVELAWYRGDTALAAAHASQVVEHARSSGMPYELVLAHICQGLKASILEDFVSAQGYFVEALDMVRKGRVGLEFEAKLMAHLADARSRGGSLPEAKDTAAEAIIVARRRTDRFAECHANIVAARAAASERKQGWRAEAEKLLGRAEALIDETGAAAFRPMVLRARTMMSAQ